MRKKEDSIVTYHKYPLIISYGKKLIIGIKQNVLIYLVYSCIRQYYFRKREINNNNYLTKDTKRTKYTKKYLRNNKITLIYGDYFIDIIAVFAFHIHD